MDCQMNAAVFSCALKSNLQDKISWKGAPSIKQDFSLPSTITYYISKNPAASTGYLKLAQSCKYFFEKLPILVAKDTYADTIICENNEETCNTNNRKCCVKIKDLAKIAAKIWLTNEINIEYASIPDYISLLSSKLYRCDIIQFEIHKQTILFEDFQFMVSSASEIYVYNSRLIYEDGSNVTLDHVLKATPNVVLFYYDCNSAMFSSSTLKNIAKLKILSKLCKLVLYNVPEFNNDQDIIMFLKAFKYAKVRLEFDNAISQQMKLKLNNVIDIVIKDENSKCFIQYNGQNDEKLKIMHKRFYQ